MKQITISQLKQVLPVFDQARYAVKLTGTYGIGKSEVIYQYAQEKAQREGRIFIDWNTLSTEQKDDAIENPSKYCAFIDFRLAQCDPSDLRGVPMPIQKKEYLISTPFSWALYITQKDASGLVFFDENNLCTNLVSASCYQIINDRVIADRAISEKVFIMAAGNSIQDNPEIFEEPLPLKDRFVEYELTFSATDWLAWAAGKINPLIYTFCAWKKSMILHHNDGKDKDVTPRGVVRVSNCLAGIDDIEKNPLSDIIISGCVGTGWCAQFKAYLKNFNELNWKTLIKNPDKVNDLNIDKKYAVIGGIVEKLFDLTKKVGTKSIKAKTPEAEVFMDYCKLLLSFDTEMFVLGKLQLANSNETNTMFTINLMINPIFKELKKMFQDRHSAKID